MGGTFVEDNFDIDVTVKLNGKVMQLGPEIAKEVEKMKKRIIKKIQKC